MKAPFKWDRYSDQATQLKDKKYKKEMRKKEFLSIVKTFLTALIILPLSLILTPFIKRKNIDSQNFFSMGVDFEREPQLSIKLLNELGVKNILLRFKLWEMQKLPSLKEFILSCQDKNITLKLLQDREHIEDLELLKKDLRTTFLTLGDLVSIYEIGSTINRAKWGFFSVDEYLRFFQVAYKLKKEEFLDTKLIGSGVIDFEYHFTAHTLFNFFNLHYDGVSALLYVDRRGAPENSQMGFNLSDKIAWLSTMVWLSPKTKNRLYITETNWPLKGTAPYAPTSEKECIDEESYADFMLRYYLLALASQQIDFVSWHQLIASGYGLVDEREGIRKRVAFKTYKFMFENLKNAYFLRLNIKRDYYIIEFLVDNVLLQIHWSQKEITLKNEEYFTAYSRDGDILKDKILKIGSSPIYIKDSI